MITSEPEVRRMDELPGNESQSLRPESGHSVETALSVFVLACKQPGTGTLFITDHWVEPRLERLRSSLSDPITSEQAEALCSAIDKSIPLDTVIDWLTNSGDSWHVFLEKRSAAKARKAEQEAEFQRLRDEESGRRQLARLGTFEGGMIAGVPVAFIPHPVSKYPDFIAWWSAVGRLRPGDAQGWSSLSGPHVLRGRAEMIAPEVWESLPESERELIRDWAEKLPLGIMYD